jgi:hypothetical protein
MKKYMILLALTVGANALFSQSKKAEIQAIKSTIDSFFVAMSAGDTVLLKRTCMPNVTLQTIRVKKDGSTTVDNQPFADFVRMLGTPTTDKYLEKIEYEKVLVEQQLASAWTPYSFYINDQFSHCGTNSFQLVKTTVGWKIQYIIDTRRKTCKKS